jgi:ABC-2 type transport system ATP-binding protein
MSLTTDVEVELRGVGLRYDRRDGDGVDALDGVDLVIPAGTIVGLLGRNGAGKTSLMSLVAALQRPTAGQVLLAGQDPWEDADRMAAVALVGPNGEGGSWKVGDALEFTAALRPGWNEAYARRLIDQFEIPNAKIGRLSRGKRAALTCVMGLAARAPVTMFDEPHLGMDAPSRYAFYDEVLRDYLAHPRTIVISTHHIDEVASLFGRVVVLERGRVLVEDDTDALRGRGTEVIGAVGDVRLFVEDAGLEVLRERRLGGTIAAAVYGSLGDAQRHAAIAAGLELGPLPLQDLFVHLTGAANGVPVEEAS